MLPAQQGCEAMDKSEDAFRTISEAAEELDLPQHVLRFWETRFPQIRPLKRGGGRRYYRPDDVELLRVIRHLLYSDGYTIKGVQRMLKERGVRAVLEVRNQAPGNAPEPAAASTIESDAPAQEHWAPETEAAPVLIARAGSAPAYDSSRDLPDSQQSAGARAPTAPKNAVASAMAPPPARPAAPSPQGLSAAYRHKIEAIVAELAECRRILGSANI